MGSTVCEKHGSTGVAQVCSHVRSSVESHFRSTDAQVWKYQIDDIEVPHWFCAACFEALRSHGLPDSGFFCDDEENDAVLERVFEQVEAVNDGVCGTCLKEWIELEEKQASGPQR